MEQFFTQNSEVILRLTVAIVLGMIVGAERLLVHKEAGMKTHSLVAMGSALFIIISEFLTAKYSNVGGFNPAIIASNVIVGIGFLGAGLIILQGNRLFGLTTASGLWAMAGIGMACGFGLFGLAIISTILILVVFLMMNILERPIRKISDENLAKEEKK